MRVGLRRAGRVGAARCCGLDLASVYLGGDLLAAEVRQPLGFVRVESVAVELPDTAGSNGFCKPKLTFPTYHVVSGTDGSVWPKPAGAIPGEPCGVSVVVGSGTPSTIGSSIVVLTLPPYEPLGPEPQLVTS